MSYPFGKEETATEEELFEFFCECLRRGDWELAQACVPQLHRGQGEIPQKVEDILQALVQCPILLRCGPDINPQRLAWLWLLVLEKWLAPEKELFETLAQGPAGSIPDRRTPQLSPEAVSVLWNLLKQAPRPAQALLELLLEDHHSASLCPSPLQKSLLDLIREALQTLRDPASQPPGVADAVCGALQALCCKAELPESEWRVLCEELLETCRTEDSPLQEERLLGCLLHKAGRNLLSLYGHTYAEKVAERPPKATLSGKDHPDPERAMLALFSTPDPAHAWKMAFFYCLSNNKHFLEQILVTALTLS